MTEMSPGDSVRTLIVRSDQGARRYFFLVSDDATELRLPRAQVVKDEDKAVAALRAAADEAGVRAAVLAPIGGSHARPRAGEHCFLTEHVGQLGDTSPRRGAWLSYEQALASALAAETRADLVQAEDEATRIWPQATPPDGLYTSTLQNQLQFLNDRMHETSDTANKFLTRFVFGGMVAVLALLNADLVMLKAPPKMDASWKWWVAASAAALILVLSFVYFRTVQSHYAEHRKSHRKLKYKFELTLYALLTNAAPDVYGRMMEKSLETRENVQETAFPEGFGFVAVGEYLLRHHSARFSQLRAKSGGYVGIAMLLVLMTFTIRIVATLLAQHADPPPTEVNLHWH